MLDIGQKAIGTDEPEKESDRPGPYFERVFRREWKATEGFEVGPSHHLCCREISCGKAVKE